MSHDPLFSIITVTYNAANTVGPTLDSVDSQTCKDYEHIIVDGASSDSTLEVVKQKANPRRLAFSEPDEGLYDAMNKGIGQSIGEYLIFLNAGDKFHSPETLEKIKKIIQENDNPGIVYGQTNLVDATGRFIAPRHLTAPENLSLRDFSRGMVVCHQAFIAARKVVPLYNLRWKFSADYEWCLICLMHSRKNVYSGDVVIDYLADGMTTANRRKSLIERFQIMSIYYGFWKTVWRHFGFINRFLKHKKELKNASI